MLRILSLLLALTLAAGCLTPALDRGSEEPVGPRDLLRDTTYRQWHIEVDFVAGHAPDQEALDRLHREMSALVHKDRIVVEVASTPLDGQGTWTTKQIVELSKQHQDTQTAGDRVVTHVLYLDGSFDSGGGPTTTLGVAIGHDTVALFAETIEDVCDFVGNPLRLCVQNSAAIESAVLLHEFGHVLGLVDHGVPMVQDHEHPDHPGHSSNPESIMTPQLETAGGVAGILDRLPQGFDAHDRQDLCNAGGRC